MRIDEKAIINESGVIVTLRRIHGDIAIVEFENGDLSKIPLDRLSDLPEEPEEIDEITISREEFMNKSCKFFLNYIKANDLPIYMFPFFIDIALGIREELFDNPEND